MELSNINWPFSGRIKFFTLLEQHSVKMYGHLNEQYDSAFVDAVWDKATPDSHNHPSVWRKDKAGAWIHKAEYGNRQSAYGWEIDHIKPVASGGKTSLENLQPLNWENNCSKGDTWPSAWEVESQRITHRMLEQLLIQYACNRS